MRKFSKICESIWSDMEDRGSGVLDKKEDAVNTLGRVKMFEYIKNHYDLVDGPNIRLGYKGIIPSKDMWLISRQTTNRGSFTIPLFFSKYKDRNGEREVKNLSVIYNEDHIINMMLKCNDEEFGELLSEIRNNFGFTLINNHLSDIHPYDRDLDNQAIIDLIDLIINIVDYPILKKKS